MSPAGRLLCAALRRDRFLIGAWAVALVLTCYVSAAVTPTLYRSAAEREVAARAIDASPAVVALYGPVLDVHSVGELAMTKLTVLYAIFVAVLVLLVVRRHARGDEEAGRAELTGATLAGRGATFAVAVTEGVAIAVLLGLLAALADIAGGLPATGSLLFGASWAGVGLVSTGLTVLACQVSASTRACGGIAGAAVGGLFVLRALGDTGPRRLSWVSWLSPFGWSTRLRAWFDPAWQVLALYVGVAALLIAVASLLNARRDLGAGLVPERRGPACGSPWLRSALALESRLHRPMLGAWALGSVVLGSLMGAIVPSVSTMLTSSDAREIVQGLGGAGAIQDTLVAAEMSVASVVLTCFAIVVVGHAAADEREGRLEAVLATRTGRRAGAGAVAFVAVGGSSLLCLLTGSAMAAGLGGSPGRVLAAAAVQLPAMWLVTAVALLAWSWGSRFAVLGWAALAVVLLLGPVVEALRLPHWLAAVSPYAHVPPVPAQPMAWTGLIVMTSASVIALALGGWRAVVRDVG